MTLVKFYDRHFIPSGHLTYSVIVARHLGKWVFVRHNDRTTWEVPGGHIEEGESPEQAAARELNEETGATQFDLSCIATYSVEKKGSTGFGRLFFAEVTAIGPISDTYEIAEAIFEDSMPEHLTYPDIQPHLFRKVKSFVIDKGRG